MLFSDGAPTPDVSWVAVAMSAIASAYAVVQLFINKRYDSRLTAAEGNLSDCQEQHRECEDNQERTDAELAAMKTEMKRRDEKDRAELEAKIATLEKQNAERRQLKRELLNELQAVHAEMGAMKERARKRHGDDPELKEHE